MTYKYQTFWNYYNEKHKEGVPIPLIIDGYKKLYPDAINIPSKSWLYNIQAKERKEAKLKAQPKPIKQKKEKIKKEIKKEKDNIKDIDTDTNTDNTDSIDNQTYIEW